ncbi:MAG: hypothetical protein KBG15_01940 [Kofleriaceae bacterium]|nr:hypothetical protein [Kofleriaceae bacterium]
MRVTLLVTALSCTLLSCGSSTSTTPPSTELGGDRPAELRVPKIIEPGKRYPLVLVLHGYGADGFLQYAFFGVRNWVDRNEAFGLAPEGLTDENNQQFWNADPACCAFGSQKPDDSTYLAGLIDEAIAKWPIDPKQVFVIGHSNGAFMAYRMACDHADKIAAIAGLAGAATSVPAQCKPSQPVSILHMHGTADTVVPYAGGGALSAPGAVASVSYWASKNGCSSTTTIGATLDLDSRIVGAETQIVTTDACPAAGAADLWTMAGSSHIPSVGDTFSPAIEQWLLAHARP